MTIALSAGSPLAQAQAPGTGGPVRVAPAAPGSPAPSPGTAAPIPSGLQALPDLKASIQAVRESGGSTIRVHVRNDGAKAGPSTVKVECEPVKVAMVQVPKAGQPTKVYSPAPGMTEACFPTKTLDVPALDTGKTHMALLGFTKCGAQDFRCQVTATVDAGQQVKELNETNNLRKQVLPDP